ncbi:MAG: Gldg family protein, partial [Myxococcota bacterium]
RLLGGAKRFLEQLNFRVAELGVGEGLGREVPPDAAAVIIAGPRKPFLPEEITALESYAESGGRLLLLLEPGEESHEELTDLFGARYHPELIHNERHHLLRSRTDADRSIIATNRFSSHPSMSTLARYSSRLAVILDGTGWLETTAVQGRRVSTTLRSMPRSWADVEPNHEFDSETERRETWDLGVAASLDLEEGGSYRSAVLAGASAVSDAYLGNRANLQWLVDTMRWLTDDEQETGLVENEEDVRIRHTKEENVVWFYGTIFAVPLLVLSGGIFHVRRRRRRSMA